MTRLAAEPVRRSHAALILFALLALLIGSAAGALGGFTNGASAQTAGIQPNIVVIMSDDQNRGSIQFMPEVAEGIADPGVRFTHSISNVPLCCPSRATFLTGRYAHNHGVWDNNAPDGGFDAFQPSYGSNNLAVWLQNAGYYTAFVGKYLNGYGDADPRFVPGGWNAWYGAIGDVQRVYDYQLNENEVLVDYGGSAEDFKQDVFTRHAVSIVNGHANAGQPFFLWLAYTAPHAAGGQPYPQPPADCAKTAQPAPRHANAFDSEPLPQAPNFNEADVSDKPPTVRGLPSLDQAAIDDLTRRYRCRLEALQSVDDGVGQVVEALAANHALENTLVIFASDNGIFQGEHRIADGKTRHYDAASRVPLVMRGPGIASGATIGDPVTNADLAPTILDVADAEPAFVPDGLSLIPLASGARSGYGRDLVLESKKYSAVRNDRYVYAEYTSGPDQGFVELYDLASDPYQLRNLASDPAYADVRSRLAQHLLTLKSCAGATCSNVPPTASFTVTPNPVRAQKTATFNAGASTDADGSIVAYQWTFGDGTAATAKVVKHSYKSAGSYTVTLKVTDDDQLTATTTRLVTVKK